MSDESISGLDRRSDLRTLVGTLVVAFLIFGVGRVPQAAFQATDLSREPEPTWSSLLGDIGLRLLVNLSILLVTLAVTLVIRILDHRGVRFVVDIVIVCLTAAAVRLPLQVAFGYYAWSDWRSVLIDGGTVAISVFALLGSALIHVSIRRRIREQVRSAARQTSLASAALDALATEELRVRKDVAEGLHGTVQQSLVVLGIRVDAVSAGLATGRAVSAEDIDELASIRADLDRIRETDVRTLSQLLYPVGLELGAVAALRLLLQRLPGTIASTIYFSDAVLALEGNGNTALPLDGRLLIVRIAEEALSNALRHGRASSVSLSLEVDEDSIVLTFDDDGFGLSPDARMHGITRLRERLEPLRGTIELLPSRSLGGTRVVARLPGIPGLEPRHPIS